MNKDITTVNVSLPDYVGKLTHKEVKLIGKVDLNTLAELVRHDFDFLDISDAEFGTEQEEWRVCLGWSHSGPVYGSSGWRKVEVLKRLLEQINAKAILLPDNVQRRHINAAKKNRHIKELQVTLNCPLFSYEDGKLMNKKKTKPIFNCKAYTVTGEIRGEWDTYNRTVDILLNDAEVEQIKKLTRGASTSDDFLSILEDKMPKLYDFLHDYFSGLAWKQVVRDGMAYYNLTRREAEEAEMMGNEYQVFVPVEFQ